MICRYEHNPQVKSNHVQDQMSGWDTNPSRPKVPPRGGGSMVERSNVSVRLPKLPRSARVRNYPPPVILLLPSHIFKTNRKTSVSYSLAFLARRGEKRKRGFAEEGARREMLDEDNCRDGRFENREIGEKRTCSETNSFF